MFVSRFGRPPPKLSRMIPICLGPVDKSVTPYVGMATQGVWKDPGQPGFLGPSYAPFKPEGQGLADMKLNGIATDRLDNRRQLLKSVDRLRREADATGQLDALDAYEQRAFDVLVSSKLVDAMDLSKEDPKIREQYGTGKPYEFQYDGASTNSELILMARRLV